MDELKVLLVDDRKENLTALGALLGKHGVALCMARSGTEALELLLAHDDVVLAIIDVAMPEMDGFELAALMRGAERTRNIPVLFLTAGGADPVRVLRAYEIGAVDFLVKPIDPRVLEAKVSVFLQLERQARALGAAERKLAAVMDAVPVGISVASDVACSVVTGNAVLLRQFEVTRQDNVSASAPSPDAPGRRVRYLHEGRLLGDHELPLQRAIADQRVVGPVELEVHLPSGRRWRAEAVGAPVRDASGQVTGGVAVTVDVTARRALEEALRTSEARFRGLFENAAVGIAHVDLEGRFLLVNDGLCRIVGWSREALCDRRLPALVHPEDGHDLAQLGGQLRSGALASVTVERRCLHENGSWTWVELTASMARDPGTEQPYYVVIAQDVHARKRTEREHAKLLALIERSEDFVGTADLDGRLTYVNPGGRRMLGLDAAADVSALTVEDYLPAEWRAFFRDEIVPTAHAHGAWRGEMQLAHLGTGDRIDVERTTFLLRHSNGEPWQYATVARDVTREKRAQAAVQRSEARFRALAESMPPLVWVAREDGTVEYYNERVHGYAGILPTNDGWRWEATVHPDDVARTQQAWESAVATREPYACEHRLLMADGTWRWHLSQARFVADGPEGGARWYGTATDIHARKEAEQQLEEAVRLRDRIAATVAHDLRSPLGAIQLQLEVMRLRRAKGERSPHELDEALTRLERQVRSMRSTVDELVDVAQLQASGALALRPRETDLVALACTVAEDQRRSSERHRVEVRSEVHSLVGTWDAERLERVLTNLVSNAIKYSPEGGLVTIELEPASDAEGDAVVLRVSDEGLGIPASDRQRVFEWFARGTNVAGVDGSGVGLASVRRIVEQHGGRVDVESAEGRGTTFTVRLPLHAAAEPSPGGARVARSPADVGAARGAGVGARRPNR